MKLALACTLPVAVVFAAIQALATPPKGIGLMPDRVEDTVAISETTSSGTVMWIEGFTHGAEQ